MPEGRKAKLNEKQLALTIEAIPLEPEQRSKEQQNMLERERNRVRGAVREVATEEERKTISELEQRLKSLEKDKPQPMIGNQLAKGIGDIAIFRVVTVGGASTTYTCIAITKCGLLKGTRLFGRHGAGDSTS